MKKNLLFISSKSSVFHIPLWRAFEGLGYRIHFVDYRGHPFLQLDNLAHRALHKIPKKIGDYLYDYGNRCVDRQILGKAKEIKPDLIFASKAKYISIETLDELRKIAPTANWYVDMMSNWGTIQNIISHYDYLFNYDRYVIDKLRSQGHNNAYHLPWCGYLEKDSVWPEKKNYKYNVVFIGSYHPEVFPRESELRDLEDLGLKVWGHGWDKSALRGCYQGFIKPSAEAVQNVYRESKIAIYLDSLYDVPGTGITLRPFEITASGAMMIGQTFRSEFPELFNPGIETVIFKDIIDMKQKIRHYLTHENERAAIAKAGFERTRREHTYHDRVKKIVDIVESKALS